MVPEFCEGSGGSPRRKGDTGRGTRAPRAMSTPLVRLYSGSTVGSCGDRSHKGSQLVAEWVSTAAGGKALYPM